MKNLLEEAVRSTYAELRSRQPDLCGCSQCAEDVLAMVLNNARARYTGGSLLGTALTSVDLQRDQTRAAIAVVVLDAMQRVALNPRHTPERSARGTGEEEST